MCVCVDRERGGAGRVRGAAQTSSIQKQMEKVMIICLANAAQSGREGSTREVREMEGGVVEGRKGECRMRQFAGHCAYAPWHI